MRISHPRQLFFLGFLTLYLELVLIRYLSGTIWNLGYFPNLVLLAVFLGMGIGFYLHQNFGKDASHKYFRYAVTALLSLVLFATFACPGLPGFERSSGEFGGELFFTNRAARPLLQSLPPFLVWFFVTLAVFALISQRTAQLFNHFTPLTAYTLDISGSLCGILIFVAVSYFQISAWIWFLGLIPLFLLAGAESFGPLQKAELALACIACSAIAVVQEFPLFDQNRNALREYAVTWSPYQKVQYTLRSDGQRLISVNGIPHQEMLTSEQIQHGYYQIPYTRRKGIPGAGKYRNVLILGAGSGNDVASALLNDADHVDAVEIDPVIAEMGKKYHPARPYQDPRVRLTVNDGRAFMNRATAKYDLVVFAGTDSLVKISSVGQLRLENYLFTEESLKRASEILTEDGDLLFHNSYRRAWLLEKIERMVHSATGYYPLRVSERDDSVMLMAGRFHRGQAPGTFAGEELAIPVDDWPFLYMKTRSIPAQYLVGISVLLSIAIGLMALLRRTTRAPAGPSAGQDLFQNLGFALMGVAFLLLETKSVIQFSLLFGTTWVNSSSVFLAVLALVLAANWCATRVDLRYSVAILLALALTSLLPLWIPLSQLLNIENMGFRYLVASLLTFSPIFFANLLFSLHFRSQQFPQRVFAWNLTGACAGGMVEYLSMAFGYRALAVVVVTCYLAAFGLLMMRRRTSSSNVVQVPSGPT
jgi:spermidine synthase